MSEERKEKLDVSVAVGAPRAAAEAGGAEVDVVGTAGRSVDDGMLASVRWRVREVKLNDGVDEQLIERGNQHSAQNACRAVRALLLFRFHHFRNLPLKRSHRMTR